MQSLKLRRSVFGARTRIGPPPLRVAPGLKGGELHRDAADVVSGRAEAGQPLFRERQPLAWVGSSFSASGATARSRSHSAGSYHATPMSVLMDSPNIAVWRTRKALVRLQGQLRHDTERLSRDLDGRHKRLDAGTCQLERPVDICSMSHPRLLQAQPEF